METTRYLKIDISLFSIGIKKSNESISDTRENKNEQNNWIYSYGTRVQLTYGITY